MARRWRSPLATPPFPPSPLPPSHSSIANELRAEGGLIHPSIGRQHNKTVLPLTHVLAHDNRSSWMMTSSRARFRVPPVALCSPRASRCEPCPLRGLSPQRFRRPDLQLTAQLPTQGSIVSEGFLKMTRMMGTQTRILVDNAKCERIPAPRFCPQKANTPRARAR